MRSILRTAIVGPAALLVLAWLPYAHAHGTEPAPKTSPPATVTTHSSVVIGGKRIPYTAVAGTLTLHNDEGRPTARMFYVAYFAKGSANSAARPITFLYNGGPGSSSVWLHMAEAV